MEDIDSGLPQAEGLRNATISYDPATDYPAAVAHPSVSRWLIGESCASCMNPANKANQDI